MIGFACPHCGHKENVPDDQTGKPVSCPRCGRLSDLPDAAVVPQPAAEAETVDIPKPNLTGDPAEFPTQPPAGSQSPLTAGLLAPIDIPGYEILGELGRGGMGVIYKARQFQPRRLVALKMILAGEYAGTEALGRFHREADAVARLAHPIIVQIYQVGEHQGRPYLTLEFVEGGNLAQRLREHRYDFRAAAELVEALAHAVQFAHDFGIIHRDLKPANILLASDGTPKITDFGLAKQIEGSMTPAAQTQSGAILGTPSYMAPEQAGGKSKTIGPPADIYALGAILYELLAGRPPFQAETIIDILMKVATEEPVPPRQLRKKCPRDLETICLTCLHKEPAGRYASAGDLADDLRRWLDDEPIKARRGGIIERLRRWRRRRKASGIRLRSIVWATLALWIVVSASVRYVPVMIKVMMNEYRSEKKAEALRNQPIRHLSPEEAARQRMEANRLIDANSLKLFAQGTRSFHGTYHFFPPQAITDRRTGKPLLSWRVALSPYVGALILHKSFKLDEPWDNRNNSRLLRYTPSAFTLSSSKKVQKDDSTFLQVFVGPGTAFEPTDKPDKDFGRQGLRMADFPDGTANTLLIVEAAESVPWTKPADLSYDPRQPLPKLGGCYEDGFFAVLADGSVRFIKNTVSEKTLRALITRNDGQPLDKDW